MAKQLLIYESAVPLSSAVHRELSFEAVPDYAFASGINAVPLTAIEILAAASEYAIVFAASGDDVMPVAVLGVRAEQNLYLSTDSRWQAKYVPAFVRRYPFVFSSSPDQKTLTLCIDETHPGFNTEGRGERLFDAEGKPTAYAGRVLEFLKEYQTQFERTRVFGRHLKDLGLLEPMEAVVSLPGGEQVPLRGFFGVSREKLRALDGAKLETLAKTDELELVYLHLASMRNFNDVKDRFVGAMATGHAAAAADEPALAASPA
jgi:hypothetical protein